MEGTKRKYQINEDINASISVRYDPERDDYCTSFVITDKTDNQATQDYSDIVVPVRFVSVEEAVSLGKASAEKWVRENLAQQ